MADECYPTSLEHELEIAWRALRDGDLRHAAFHVAGALGHDPDSVEALEILEALVARADDPLSLAPIEPNAWYGMVAVHAHILLGLGRTGEGLYQLARVAEAAPHVPYLSWLRLVSKIDGVPEGKLADTSAALLRMAIRMPERLSADHPAIKNARFAVDFLGLVREQYGNLAVPLHASAVLLRRLGRIDQALEQARRLDALRPDMLSAGTLTSTLRVAGDLEGALAASKMGANRAPDQAAPLLDVGDIALELRRPAEALVAYEQAMVREPGQLWASAGALFARFLVHRDEADRRALRDFVAAHPDEAHAHRLLTEIGVPLTDVLPIPVDATANGLRELRKQKPPESGPWKISMGLSHPEGPSNLIACSILGTAIDREIELSWSFADVPHPDPREPMPGTPQLLFRREGEKLVPALALPTEAVAREVGSIASLPYSLARWASKAEVLGRALGPSRVDELLRTMVHPPAMPRGDMDPPSWVQGVQVAAALAISHIDGGWHGSQRRSTLLALAGGPVDWTVTAAIVALLHVGSHDSDAALELPGLFEALCRREPDAGGCTYAIALRQAWLQLPGIDEATQHRLSRDLAAL